MSLRMPDWLSQSHASYVLAAYGVAAGGWLGLFLLSLRSSSRRRREWQKLEMDRPRGNQG